MLKAHVDVVPELVGGGSLDELLDSVEPARKAYHDIVTRLHQDAPATMPQPPAGQPTAVIPLDLARIPTEEKLRRGLKERAGRSRR